jgi:DNA-binding Lrp family transcriptional regulator
MLINQTNGEQRLSYFEELIPSAFHYFEKFKELDETDLEIIFTMAKECPDGPRNVHKIAQKLVLPHQTVNYRVQRFDAKDLVRFCAIINESLLGLANYVVIATVKPGLLYENKKGQAINAGTFLTCYPVWRVLQEIHGGYIHGFFVQYSIPYKKENDLKLFLDELKKIGCIMKVNEFCKVTQSYSNMPSLELFLRIRKTIAQGQRVSFNWEKWADDFDRAEEATLPEETTGRTPKISFSYEDLLTLFHLERNLRAKISDIAKLVEEPSIKVVRRYKEILSHRLISGCRVDICPVDPISAIHLLLELDFANGTTLRKFVSHLNEIPYRATYQKVAEKDSLFLHMMIPSPEYFDFHNTFEDLSRRQGIIRAIGLYISDFYARFDNIELFEAFSKRDNKWAFSIDVMRKALSRLRKDTKFEF